MDTTYVGLVGRGLSLILSLSKDPLFVWQEGSQSVDEIGLMIA
jgi:hypothetical protein